MRTAGWLLCPAFALATACGKSGDRAAEAPGSATTAASSFSAGRTAIVTVLYNEPKDSGGGFDALVGAETK